jgi:outer membrane protein OmpA-like peptidoglycan-associated protein
MKKTLLLLICIISLFTSSNAQDFLGLRQSNYSGIMGSDLNPASIADSRYKVDVLVFGAYLSIYNNHAYFNTKKMPHWWIKSFDSNDPASEQWLEDSQLEKLVSVDSTSYYESQGKGQFFEIDNGNKNRSAFINMELDVLNFMITLNRKRAIGFQIRNRTIFNLDDASPELIRLATNDFDFKNAFNQNINDEKLNISMNSWIEYNLSYAQILLDREQHFFKIGGKLKFLQGVGSFYLHSKNLDFNIQNDTTANAISGDFDYGYSENLGGFVESDNSTEEFAGSNVNDFTSKLGLGVDIGIIYEWRPDWQKYKYDMDGKTDLWMRDQNKYKLRLGFAINDIGGMRYEKGGLSNNFNLNVGVFDLRKFDNTQGFRSLDSTLTSFADSGYVTFNSTDDREFYMNLPTHANFDIDYNIWKNIYVNFYTRINLVFSNDVNSVHYPTSFALTPRWDHKRWGVSLPFSYNGVSGFRTGLALRLGSYFSIGTGDLKPLVAPGRDMNVRGVDVFFALRVPVLFKAPKDRDKDGVSDKLDECIDIPGVWELRGCSDIDHDGILDQNDSCVTDSGLVKFNGCPDRDGDDIMDKLDDCPDTPGIPEFKGCPDTDGDGLMDKEDDCPEFPGPIENKGCPYKMLHVLSDLGEILETDTLFPGEERFMFKNLPFDKSHLFKLEPADENSQLGAILEIILFDSLGNEKIIKAFKDERGYFVYTYIPPVVVKLDTIPEGDVEIELEEEEQEILNTAFANLEFETGKDKIKEVSFSSLEELAGLLAKKLEWKLRISGYTDSVGKASNNLKLSKKRAIAVKNFLILNGVAAERLEAEWFGEDNPVASNKTKEGRQKNRRVEMKVLQF